MPLAQPLILGRAHMSSLDEEKRKELRDKAAGIILLNVLLDIRSIKCHWLETGDWTESTAQNNVGQFHHCIGF